MSYGSLTGVRAPGLFDELYVRSPPKIGPFVPVLSFGGSIDLDGERDIIDNYSHGETSTLIASVPYSKAESDALFQTGDDVTEALSQKKRRRLSVHQ